MKSQTPYSNKAPGINIFRFSGALVKENLKRFWMIPLIGFLAYFAIGILPLLTYSADKKTYMITYISNILQNHNVFIMFIHLALPIIVSIAVFRYLHSPSSAALHHSMPFTREEMFNSSVISGLLMIIAPIFLLTLCFVGIETSGILTPIDNFYMENPYVLVVNIQNIFYWLLCTIIMVTSIFSISAFAATISGTSLMQGVLSFCLNFVLSAIYLTTTYYSSKFLFGYIQSSYFDEIALKLSPFTGMVFTNNFGNTVSNMVSTKLMVIYIVASIIILLISSRLYKIRKLERAGDSLVFNPSVPVLLYLFTFFGMTFFNMWYQTVIAYTQNFATLALGYLFGAILFFIIGRMIVLKTIGVFNIHSLKSFLGFAVLVVAMFAFISFDVVGYQNRIPDINSVQSVSLNQSFEVNYISPVQNNSNYTYMSNTPIFKDKENISKIQNIHRYIVEHRSEFSTKPNYDNLYSLSFEYRLKNGKIFTRLYQVSDKFLLSSEDLSEVYMSNEVKNSNYLNVIKADEVLEASLSPNYKYINKPNPEMSKEDMIIDSVSISSQHKAALLAALKKDYLASTFAEEVNTQDVTGSIDMLIKIPENIRVNNNKLDPYKYSDSETLNVTLTLHKSYKNTNKFLNDNGYIKKVTSLKSSSQKIIDQRNMDDKLRKSAAQAERVQ